MKATIKIDVREIKSFRGTRTGELEVKIGDHEIRAHSKDELEKKIWEWMEGSSRRPFIGVVKADGEIAVFQEWNGGVETIKAEGDSDGIMKTRATSFSSGDIKDVMNSHLLHIAQCEWDFKSPAPDYLNDKCKKEFDSWCKWQLDYKRCLDSGMSSCEAHSAACGNL